MTVFSDENINTLIYILIISDRFIGEHGRHDPWRHDSYNVKPDLKITTNRSHGVQNKVGGAFKDLRNQKIIKCVV